jgi:hypothetical protein
MTAKKNVVERPSQQDTQLLGQTGISKTLPRKGIATFVWLKRRHDVYWCNLLSETWRSSCRSTVWMVTISLITIMGFVASKPLLLGWWSGQHCRVLHTTSTLAIVFQPGIGFSRRFIEFPKFCLPFLLFWAVLPKLSCYDLEPSLLALSHLQGWAESRNTSSSRSHAGNTIFAAR